MATVKDHFQYLDKLRDSGRCNMWGAAAYLQNERGLTSERAKQVHAAWMETFDGKTSLEDRVSQSGLITGTES